MLRYKEIKNMIIEMVMEMQPGQMLPSRTKLCEMLDTTRATVDKAIRELENENILKSHKGSGTSVVGMMEGTVKEVENWCVIVPTIMEQVYAALLRGIENVAQKNNTNIILCNSDSDGDKQEQYIRRLMHSGVSGFIIVPVISHDARESYRLYESLLKAKIPFIFCNRSVEGIDAPVVKSNDFYGGYIATKHLIENGYRNIAYIAQHKYRTSIDRCQGYISALMEHGLEINRRFIIVPQEKEVLDTYEAMRRLLKTEDAPDAVFCFNDYVAQNVIKAIEDEGLQVSGDIGIVGYDNMAVCEEYEPKITSIAYKSTEIGEKAAELLVKILQGHQLSSYFEYYLFHPSIIVRGSSLGRKEKHDSKRAVPSLEIDKGNEMKEEEKT